MSIDNTYIFELSMARMEYSLSEYGLRRYRKRLQKVRGRPLLANEPADLLDFLHSYVWETLDAGDDDLSHMIHRVVDDYVVSRTPIMSPK